MNTFKTQYTRFQDAVDSPDAQAWLNALSDRELALLWNEFGNIAIFDSDAVADMIENGEYDLPIEGMEDDTIDENFVVWERGTDRMEIWRWFDEHFSQGLGEFMEYGLPPVKVFPNIRACLLEAAQDSEEAGDYERIDEAILAVLEHAYEQYELNIEANKYDIPNVSTTDDFLSNALTGRAYGNRRASLVKRF